MQHADSDIIDTIAGIIADESSECHRYGNGCQLGYVGNPTVERILTALRERYVIVELPEPPLNVLIGGEPESVYVSDRLDELNITISGTVSIYADEAPALAAALLAAAEEGK